MASSKEIEYQIAHIDDDRSGTLIASHIICLVLAGIAVCLRLICRRMSKAAIQADDYMIIVAFIFAAGETTTTMICVRVGGGKHAIRCSDPETYAKSALATETIYAIGISCVKFSVLLLYRRIFPNRHFRALLWALGGFILLYSVILFFSVIFQCNPIRAVWDFTLPAKCINLGLEIMIMSALNATTDLLTLCLPLPLLWKLHLPKQRKIQLMGVFMLGGFVCIVSVYRTTQVQMISLDDAPWSDVDGAIWSIVEVCVGIVSGCLPLLLPIFNKIAGYRSVSKTSANKKPGHPSDPSSIKMRTSKPSWPRPMHSRTKVSDEGLFTHTSNTDVESNREIESNREVEMQYP